MGQSCVHEKKVCNETICLQKVKDEIKFEKETDESALGKQIKIESRQKNQLDFARRTLKGRSKTSMYEEKS